MLIKIDHLWYIVSSIVVKATFLKLTPVLLAGENVIFFTEIYQKFNEKVRNKSFYNATFDLFLCRAKTRYELLNI